MNYPALIIMLNLIILAMVLLITNNKNRKLYFKKDHLKNNLSKTKERIDKLRKVTI